MKALLMLTPLAQLVWRDPSQWLASGMAFVIACPMLVLSLRSFRRRAALRAMPTTPIAGVFVGEVELKGRARTPNPLKARLSGASVVLYNWTAEEHWTRTRVESYTDGKGRTKTRTVTYSGTDTVAHGGESSLLLLDDATGVVQVLPEGAKLEAKRVFCETVGRGDRIYYEHGPQRAVSGSDGLRTFTEHAIEVDAPLFVVGYAREREDIVDIEIAAGGRKGTATADARPRMFLISTRDEEAVTWRFGAAAWGWLVVAALAPIVLALVDMHRYQEERLAPWTAAAVGSALGLVWVVAWSIWTHNDLVDLRNRVMRARSNVDVQLRRRHDLIAQLIGAVRGLRDHEASLQRVIAEIRSQGELMDMASANARAVPVGPQLRFLAEALPNLKSSDSFLALQRSLSDCERRIALARDEFNGTTAGFNTRITTVPTSFIALLFGMRPGDFFSAEQFERSAPVVSSPAHSR